MDDPFFTIEFFEMQEKKALIVKIDSINNVPVHVLNEKFQKQASSFRLPLSPVSNESVFYLNFSVGDTIKYEKEIHVSYLRRDKESNGTIKVVADQFRVILHDFDSIAPPSFDPIKQSNELKLQVFL
jgi:hypothetical protein